MFIPLQRSTLLWNGHCLSQKSGQLVKGWKWPTAGDAGCNRAVSRTGCFINDLFDNTVLEWKNWILKENTWLVHVIFAKHEGIIGTPELMITCCCSFSIFQLNSQSSSLFSFPRTWQVTPEQLVLLHLVEEVLDSSVYGMEGEQSHDRAEQRCPDSLILMYFCFTLYTKQPLFWTCKEDVFSSIACEPPQGSTRQSTITTTASNGWSGAEMHSWSQRRLVLIMNNILGW